jgi:GT2 family glycosyltransferase
VYGGHYLGSHQGIILGEVKAPADFKTANQLFAKDYISHQSTIFRSKFLKDLGGFDINLKIAADWDLMVRASKLDAGLTIGKSVSVFYLGGLSTKSRQIANVELLKLRKKYLGRQYFLASYIFFLYRFIRNFFVLILENTFPSIANFIRKLRFNFR